MKVLVVTNMYPTAERPHFGIFVARQVAALRRAGIEMAVEEVAASRGRADYLLARRRVGRRVAHDSPDVVHVHFGYTGIAGLGHGPPVVLTLHGSDVHGAQAAGWRRRLGAAITRKLAARADRVIVQSSEMKRQLPASLADRVDVIPNGIDEQLFRPLPTDEARARLGLARDELVLLFVDGAHSANKRRDLADATVAALRRQGRVARLLVAEGVPPDEMPWYYAAADALLMTSDHEGSPMCVKEALACGTAVVSVPVGDVAEVVDTASRGIITGRDPEALARAVCEVEPRSVSPESRLPQGLQEQEVARRLVALYQAVADARTDQ